MVGDRKIYQVTTVRDTIRVIPSRFGENLDEVVLEICRETFEGTISKDLGLTIVVIDLIEIGPGRLVPGDGAAFFDVAFTTLNYLPEDREFIIGDVVEVTDFGARIIAVTIGKSQIRVGVTMRQAGLGVESWVEEWKKATAKGQKKAKKAEKAEPKKKEEAKKDATKKAPAKKATTTKKDVDKKAPAKKATTTKKDVDKKAPAKKASKTKEKKTTKK
ncbi:MAG: hypothetical protein GNW80_13360 [Asgard group archaeon]|nr:hypothetical protein [Asgard group archaeon]